MWGCIRKTNTNRLVYGVMTHHQAVRKFNYTLTVLRLLISVATF